MPIRNNKRVVLALVPAASAVAAVAKLAGNRIYERGARMLARLPTESRPVRLAQIGEPFQKTASALAGDGSLSPTIVTPTSCTMANGSGAVVNPSEGAQRGWGRQRSHFSPRPHAYIGGFWTNRRITLGRLRRSMLLADTASGGCPAPAPQGGAWYGRDVSFAGPASGAFQYLEPC